MTVMTIFWELENIVIIVIIVIIVTTVIKRLKISME